MSKKISTKYFNEDNPPTSQLLDKNSTIPGADFNTLEIDLDDFAGAWELIVTRQNSDGNVSWTIEYSHDKTTWLTYDQKAVNLSIPQSVTKKSFVPRYIRVAFKSSGNPTGWVEVLFNRILLPVI